MWQEKGWVVGAREVLKILPISPIFLGFTSIYESVGISYIKSASVNQDCLSLIKAHRPYICIG